MLINAIVGFLVALLMGMGVGGGGLFVIFLTLCLNYAQINAQGTNLMFFIIAILASFIVHVRKRKLFKRQILIMAVMGSLGSVIFSNLVNYVDPQIPRKMLGGLLVVGGVVSICNSFVSKKKKTDD
ncbi:MAG: TSUP family transporter [Clostridia bacterium]|nr:TSUP family transporter [Clostridia bacterium]